MARIDRKAFYVRRLRGSIYPYGNQFENPSMRGCAVGGGVLTYLISFFWEIAVGTSEIVGKSPAQWESHWFFVCEGSSVCISFPRKIAHVSRNFKTGLWAVQAIL